MYRVIISLSIGDRGTDRLSLVTEHTHRIVINLKVLTAFQCHQ